MASLNCQKLLKIVILFFNVAKKVEVIAKKAIKMALIVILEIMQ